MDRGKQRKRKYKKKDTPKVSISILPHFVISHVFSFCSPISLCATSATCKAWHKNAQPHITETKIDQKILIKQPISGPKNGSFRLINVQCPSCFSVFEDKQELLQHIKYMSECSLPYQCPRCARSYFTKNSRLQHMKQANHQWTAEELEKKKKLHNARLMAQHSLPNNTQITKVPSSSKARTVKDREVEIESGVEINIASLKIGEEIGDGPGINYKGAIGGKNIVRVVNLRGVSTSREVNFKKVANILRKIQHPLLVPFIGSCRGSLNFHLAYKYTESISLYGYIRILKTEKHMGFGMIRTIATEVARAMRQLHSHNPPIAHGDLRTINILLDKDHHAQVINYGVNELYPRRVHNDAVGYLAPELEDSPKLTEATDVYCFAMVLYSMITSKEPFEEFNALQISDCLSENRRPPILRPNVPQGLLTLISRCWHQFHLCRPRFKKIERMLLDDETWK